jgi:electron transfer flavoprotein alpha subunit
VVSPSTFKRYIYAGNALTTVESKDEKRVVTVRTTTFEAAPAEGGNATIETAAAVDPAGLARFVGREVQSSARPDLGSARVVVSGGRGVGSSDNFQIIEKLADSVGAAVGASRAPRSMPATRPMTGRSARPARSWPPTSTSPSASPAPSSTSPGMKDSKVIVAINKDEEAPIFQVADYGLVGDLFKLVPELTEKLEAAKD